LSRAGRGAPVSDRRQLHFPTATITILARLSIDPEQVTDLIITHIHSDHAEGADLFPKAQIWIQKTEYDQTLDASEKTASKDGRLVPDYVAALKTLKDQGARPPC
jgi:glyoxylase-like metal-dependent hydrolase (beta-lactamase superfamily II)